MVYPYALTGGLRLQIRLAHPKTWFAIFGGAMDTEMWRLYGTSADIELRYAEVGAKG